MATFPSKLAAGVYGSMEFDFSCNRGHFFNELHLHGKLNEIACSNFDSKEVKVVSGFAAPALQEPGNGGRNREIDLAIIGRASGHVKYALEAKWAGSSHCKEETILIDLCRLAAINRADPTTECLFVLAGGKDAVQKVLEKGILGPDATTGKRLLSYPYTSHSRTFLLPEAVLSKYKERLAKSLTWVPSKIESILYKPSHEETPNWVVLVWRITA